MSKDGAGNVISRLGLPHEILKNWWTRRYLSGREPTLTYDFVGLALSVVGRYMYVCLSQPLALHQTTQHVSHWGISRVDLDEQGELRLEGIRIWNDPAENEGRDLTPGLWYSDFSFFKTVTEGWGELHWTFFHYPWDAWKDMGDGPNKSKRSKKLESLKEDLSKWQNLELRDMSFREKNKNDPDIADPFVPNEDLSKNGKYKPICDSVIKGYLDTDECRSDFRRLREDRAPRSLWLSSGDKPPPFYRGYVFTETDRHASPDRYPEWCLSGQYVRIPIHPREAMQQLSPIHGGLYFFRFENE